MKPEKKKHNILFYHDTGLYYGSTEKLLQTIAKNLTPPKFNVYFLYSDKKYGAPRFSYFSGSSVKLIKFDYDYKMETEPFKIVRMKPSIMDIVNKYHIECIFLTIFSNYQFPINIIPSTIPIIAVSPFGHWSTNGNAFKTYCSGSDNKKRAERKGAKNAETFLNPLTDPPSKYLTKPPLSEVVVFGRIGRADDNIFDPISISAFKKLEDIYGNKVRYDIVAPPPAMVKLAKNLGIQNIRFFDPIIDEEQLARFYYNIDVFAHARRDGETIGIAIAEAMMAGNPVITHKSHFHNDHLNFLDNSFARWSEPDDVETYFGDMKWFVENKNLIRDMGLLAREKSRSLFGLENIIAHVSEDIENACSTCKYWRPRGKIFGQTKLFFINCFYLPVSLIRRIIKKFLGIKY